MLGNCGGGIVLWHPDGSKKKERGYSTSPFSKILKAFYCAKDARGALAAKNVAFMRAACPFENMNMHASSV